MLKKNCIPWVWLPYHGSLIIVAFLLLMVPWETARAGGLYLQEFGTPSMGVASAGAEALAVDASAATKRFADIESSFNSRQADRNYNARVSPPAIARNALPSLAHEWPTIHNRSGGH